MKGDFSRNTFNSRKHYSGVLMQQGRVQLDADWNEQLQIEQHRTETEAIDTIGLCGVPKGSDSFKLELVQDDLAILPGRIYVDGLLCELESTPVTIAFIEGEDQQVSVPYMTVDGSAFQAGQWVEISGDGQTAKLARITSTDEGQKVLELSESIADYRDKQNARVRRIATYTSQPDYLSPQFATPPDPENSVLSKLSLTDGTYLAYLHVWQEHVTALDDPLIREKALGGPDTATRIKNVWQLELLSVTQDEKGGGGDKSPEVASCETQFRQYDDLIAASTGRMNARTHFVEDPKNPCVLPPSSGYQRLENQLYRVEIQKGGELGVATFKWSRENGSVLTTIEKVDGSTLTVTDVGKDEFLSFINGGWAEIVDAETELKGEPYALVHIKSVNPATREIELDALDAAFETKTGLKLRRWDQEGENLQDGILTDANWVALEGGIEVEFSDGKYKAGDYWLIPARTATGEIEWPPFATPNTDPIPQPPAGISHHFCRLALVEVVAGKADIVDDCRKEFPPLTHICAEDVCFDNTECQMPNVETVQDAIERLCDRNDLRFHNRHLHGWGIVCGMEVYCGPDNRQNKRRHVTVKNGYAIDCMGNDVLVEQDAPLDLMTMIEQYNDAHPNDPLFDVKNPQGGEVCLYLTGEASQPFALEKYDPKQNTLQSLLKGTLLMDFYNDCIKKLVDFFIDEFTAPPEESNLPVGPTQKRFTTFLNLLIQFVNPATGQYVYLSGERGKEDPKTEHTILSNFYEKLLALLQSHTFCAMFEGARPFPEYPFATTGMRTLFGKNFHTRLRIHPQGRMAFTCGSNDKIHVYDLAGEEMVAVMDFPGGKAAIVQDVAFSPNGRQLYVVGLLNNKDTMFAVADIPTTAEGGKFDFKWRTPTVICDVLLITLTTTSKVTDKVFAVGKNKGLYDINPDNVNATPQPMYPFNAIGQITTLDQTGRAFATANASTAGNVDEYDRVLSLNLTQKETTPPTLVLNVGGANLKGSDDLAVVPLKGQDAVRLYVVANSPQTGGNRFLILADATKMTSVGTLDLQEDTEIRLAFNPATQHLMLTYEDNYHVRTLDDKEQLERTFRLPVQIDPISIAVGPEGRRVFVLNHTSNTITTVSAERVDPKAQLDLEALAEYRREIIEAFADLFGGFLQYVKDCFCDHFLVKCPPECTPEDKLYLACIRIKDEQVFKVCNFSRRKYVKSFPTVGYWLSLFPAIPLISHAVEVFCCAVLPNFFGKFHAPQVKEGGRTRVKGKDIRNGIAVYQQTNVRAMLSEQLGKVKLGGKLLTDSLTQKYTERFQTQKPATPPPASVKQNEVVGKPTDEAKATLATNKVLVKDVQQYDRSKGATNLIRLAEAPHNLEAGANITLYEENGVVKYYAPAEDVPAPVKEFLREEIKANTVELADTTSIRADVKTLQAQLADTQKRQDTALADRDNQIALLRANVAEVAAARPAATADASGVSVQIADLQKQFSLLQKTHADALAARDQQITELRANIQTATVNKDALTQATAMRDQVVSLQQQLATMQKSNAEALAARDQQIAQLRTTTEGFQKRINLGGIAIPRSSRAPRKGKATKKGKGKKPEGEGTE